ncbi:CPBP family intramembrane glutamic endopeptidase [Maribacter thermophilus]|uniref:CPBP family intramembrane glutamic endopeptidase n=1 Tax=Maribacter thermophilus TaxID=1197874 RepID=UPI0006411F45|nr:CPBP family intramembrane glutamic endopeptidase [Maribacter thermophilus]
MLKEVVDFAKKPIYLEEKSTGTHSKIRTLVKLVAIALVISIGLSIVIGIVQLVFNIDVGKHAMDDFLEAYSPIYLLLGAVVAAPVIEELLFRGPMIWFRNNRFFPYIFYVLTLGFGFMHISNYEITIEVILLSPLLVAPQISVGILLGFIRVKFGLLWSMALHALYNLVLVGPIFLFKILDIPIE